MKRFIVLALAASAAVCLTACTTAQLTQFDNAISLQITALNSAKTVLQQDQAAGLLNAATLAKATSYISAAESALLAAEDAFMAGNATTEQAKIQDVAAALLQFNQAVLTVVQATLSSEAETRLQAIERPYWPRGRPA